jgi:chemotaxis protein methyltransferase WspC
MYSGRRSGSVTPRGNPLCLNQLHLQPRRAARALQENMQAIIKRFSQLFKEKIGLNPSLISDQMWYQILNERMTLCGIEDMDVYYQYLLQSPLEFQEFIEHIIVPETWFFREIDAWDVIKTYLAGIAKPHILSLPCSTGEEPYSIFIMLLESGFAPNQISIDAADISKKALVKARLAVYDTRSFRGTELSFRDRYFTKVGMDYKLHSQIRQGVNFFYGNLFGSISN